MATAAIIVAAVATTASVVQSNKARRERKRANKIAAKQAKLQQGRSAIAEVRKAQLARASILQQGENQGAGESTAVAGATGAVQSQAGGNIAFAQQIFGLQNSANRLRQSAQTHMDRSSGFRAIGNLAMQTGSMFGGGTPSSADGSGTVMNDNFRGIGS